jgi:hypothetical protein
MERKCSYCTKEFQGRLNQKFCSSKCKNNYHNAKNREENSVVNRTNKSLIINWNILKKMHAIYKSKPVALDLLEANGYKTRFHTHTSTGIRGGKYIMVYDYGYTLHFDNQIQIVFEEM